MELHTFCDASPQVFAAAVYVRTVTLDGLVYVQLIMAKSKFAPNKTIYMSKLELQACLLGSRLSKFVQNSLQNPNISQYIWTDWRRQDRQEAGRMARHCERRTAAIIEGKIEIGIDN